MAVSNKVVQTDQFRGERRILRIEGVKAACGLGTTHIYNLMKAGKFPRSRRIGSRAVGWDSQEVMQWVADRLDGAA